MEKVAKLSETKPWITDDELKDVTDKVDEIRKWFDALIEEQESKPKHADPIVKASDIMGKIEKLKKLYTKVSKKKKPKPPKEEKPKEEGKEDGDDANKDGEATTDSTAEKDAKTEQPNDSNKDESTTEKGEATVEDL